MTEAMSQAFSFMLVSLSGSIYAEIGFYTLLGIIYFKTLSIYNMQQLMDLLMAHVPNLQYATTNGCSYGPWPHPLPVTDFFLNNFWLIVKFLYIF